MHFASTLAVLPNLTVYLALHHPVPFMLVTGILATGKQDCERHQ